MEKEMVWFYDIYFMIFLYEAYPSKTNYRKMHSTKSSKGEVIMYINNDLGQM